MQQLTHILLTCRFTVWRPLSERIVLKKAGNFGSLGVCRGTMSLMMKQVGNRLALSHIGRPRRDFDVHTRLPRRLKDTVYPIQQPSICWKPPQAYLNDIGINERKICIEHIDYLTLGEMFIYSLFTKKDLPNLILILNVSIGQPIVHS